MVWKSRVATISGAGRPAGEGFSFESYRFPGKTSSEKQPIAALSYTSHGFNGVESPGTSLSAQKYPRSHIFPIGRSPSYERAILSSLKNPDKNQQKQARDSSLRRFAHDEIRVSGKSSKPKRTESNSSSHHPESVTTLTSLASSESGPDDEVNRSMMRIDDPESIEMSSSDAAKRNIWPLVLSPDTLLSECDSESQADTSLPPYSMNSNAPILPADSPKAPTPLRRRTSFLPNGKVPSGDRATQNCIATQTIISIPNFTSEGREYPYLREMRERLLSSDDPPPLAVMDEHHNHPEARLLQCQQQHTPVGTVVKLNADGYGSHTSPTHRVESCYTSTLERRRGPVAVNVFGGLAKNAKTSSFITLSMLYATLLIVVCLGFLLSEVLTHNVPLYYYEAFFTYLYGGSILFLLYVFCYLLTGSGGPPKPKNSQGPHSGQYNVPDYDEYYSNEEGASSSQKRKGEEAPGDETSPTTEKLTGPATPPKPRKHKISDNEHSHGSFFLRIGAIAFGLGTMIYNGLEFGVFLEIPLSSPCHMILRGVNPIAQLVFTFMQMYFIFMNARLNIHKFKVIARFGLMHMVATNVCVWIRTLVRESLKEINEFKVSQGSSGEDYMIMEGIRRALERNGLLAPNRYLYNLDEFIEMQEINDTMVAASRRLTQEDIMNRSCGRVEIMGSIVSDSAPYLYPFIIEYSLIAACVLFIMWKHIGRSPKYMRYSAVPDEYVFDPELGDGISVASRRCQVKVDCIGASKGLFCGLLVLVSTLICLILFFVLVNQEDLRRLAIYLADVSHCGIMVLSIVAIFIGFCRVRQLRFHGEREEELDDILLMVSAFGLFAYAIFSAVAGSLSAYTEEPNLLVLVTSSLSILQVIIQMVFIKDTQRRQVRLPEHERTKPGRQIITFLLICNLAMWIVYTFETQKVEANPVQLEFFGKLAWTILLRCTIPLAIFHRFHSTVVLAAIWKNSYKSRIE
ncbi:proton channel OtopLc isoform X8 [Hyalella azteca]|uniref:Proton channel OtopLc isoform X8 n=1 Tax=Hyalella azteca TaxID=294128 RepID=A0A979FQK7_HYAAZ|nr:proton channel OtopLc isoform X8 [Hyalella azteca]